MTIWSRCGAFGLSLVLFIFQTFSSSGQERQPASGAEGEEIEISADSVSVGEAGTQVEAKGNVEVQRGETVLKADEVRVDRATKDVEAAGGVSLDSPEWKLKAESVQLNMEEETGEILQGDIFFDRDHLSLFRRESIPEVCRPKVPR
jgi:lipopolysaccharide assembly outer membrane protein LptD (OstA)